MIREKYPYTKVLVVTSLIDPKVLERAKSGCADSLWYKDHGEEDIRSVIYRTLNGEHVFPDMTPKVALIWVNSALVVLAITFAGWSCRFREGRRR